MKTNAINQYVRTDTPIVTPQEAETIQDALDKLQQTFYEALGERPEYLAHGTHIWNIGVKLWREWDSDEPIDKNEVLNWRAPSNEVKLVGENKARELIGWMFKDGYLEEYLVPEYPRAKFIRGTEKLFNMMLTCYTAFSDSFKDSR